MQPSPPSARRFAVAMQNRRHPIPAGVFVVVALLIVGGILLYASTLENPEIKQLRQEIQRNQAELQQDLKISEWERAHRGSCGECEGTGKVYLQSSRISCPRCQGTGKLK